MVDWHWAREHHFKDGDPFTKMLQKHEHIQDTRDKIVNGLANHTIKLKNPYTNNYALGGLSGVPKYLRDYSTLMTGGLTGNIAVTFLGSYGLKYEVLSIDEQTWIMHQQSNRQHTPLLLAILNGGATISASH